MYFQKLFVKGSMSRLLFMIIAGLSILPMIANADTQPKEDMNIGYTTELFIGVDHNDASIAISSILRKPVVRQIVKFHPEIFALDVKNMVKDVNSGKIDILSMLTVSYLHVRDQLNAVPFLVPVYDGKIEHSYVLLVRKDKNLSAIDQLRNKKIIIEKGFGGSFALLWLDTLLFEKNLPESSKVFKTIRRVDRPSNAAHPVFFGQADACVIRRSSFELLVDLNPQLKEKLKIMLASKPVMLIIGAMRKDLNVDSKESAIKLIEEFHNLPGGKQLLMLIHTDLFVPYKPEYLKNIENIYKRYEAGKKRRFESDDQVRLNIP